MRSTRSIRNRIRRTKIAMVDLDITSLLDILVIMLVFLLKSYNSSGIIFNVPPSVKLPISQSQEINTSGTIVQVSPRKIWVDEKIVLDKDKDNANIYDQNKRRIIPLYNELIKKRDLIKEIKYSSKDAKDFTGRVNLVVDKTIKYSEIKKILYTTAEAGFRQYKFIVLGEE